jgi:ribosome-binding protein aMBF1 (putative translation factor)
MGRHLARIELTAGTTAKDLATFLRTARHAGKKTQLDVSNKMAIPPTAVARIESGALEPKTLTMNRFARALGRRLVLTIE